MCGEAARVRREADGRWACRPYLGTSATGRKVRPYRSWPAETPEEVVRAEAAEWVATLTSGGRPSPRRLDEALAAYVDELSPRGYAPNTVRSYRQHVRNVTLYLGGADPATVDAADLDELEALLLSRGGRSGAALSASSVLALHAFLRGAFAWMCRRGVRADNPMLSVAPPSPSRHEALALDARGLRAVNGWVSSALPRGGAANDARRAVMAMAFWLALHGGLRVGEACALRERDLAPAGIHVSGSVYEGAGGPRRRECTKGRRSRNVALTADEVATLWRFVVWRDGRLSGCPDDGPVLTLDGGWLAPSVVSGAFSALARELGLPGEARYHTLRHTHATWLLQQGVDMRTVSERLGHADVATTMRLYAHVLPGRDAEAAASFGRALDALGGGANGVPDASGPRAGTGAGKAQVGRGKPGLGAGPGRDKA